MERRNGRIEYRKKHPSFRTAAISQKEKKEKRLGRRRTKSISRILAMFSKLKA